MSGLLEQRSPNVVRNGLFHLFTIALLLAVTPAVSVAQTSSEIERLIRHSQVEVTPHPLNVIVQPDKKKIIISTYRHSETTDQDLKITALLMLKEILRKYPRVNGIQVNFFKQSTEKTYKMVVVGLHESRQIDAGKSVEDVLAGVQCIEEDQPETRGELTGVWRWTNSDGSTTIRQYGGAVTGFFKSKTFYGNFSGSYEPAKRILEINYRTSAGPSTARFALSSDGRFLRGNWYTNDRTGKWDMYR
jgi:hypothetical protein